MTVTDRDESATVTAADIARLTGYGRAAVSNWRRRYDDFPQPVGGTASSPQFALTEIEEWLVRRGKSVEVTPAERFWQRVRATTDDLALAHTVADLGDFLAHGVRSGAAEEFSAELDALAIPKGELFEFLLDRYMEAHARRVMATPRQSAQLMAALTDVKGATVLDPSCGTGKLLLSAHKAGAVRVLGQDQDPVAVRIAGARMALRGIDAEIRTGDSLRNDAFPGMTAEVVLCDPPFGERSWGHEELIGDVRWVYGLPPRGESELAWVQHVLWHTAPGGRAAVLMPSAASDRRSGRRIRSQLLRSGALRAVFELPGGTTAGSSAAPHLWLLRRPADGDRLPSHLLMADLTGVADFEAVALDDWREFQGRPDLETESSKGVPVIALLDDVVDLTPSRRLVRPIARGLDFGTAYGGLLGLLDELRQAVAELRSLTVRTRNLPMTTVAELVQSGVVSVRQPPTRMETSSGDIPVLTAKDVTLGREPSGRTTGMPGLVRVEAGDVVVATAFGRLEPRVVLRSGPVAGPQTQVFRPDPGRCDPYFLACFLRAAGVARPSAVISRADGRRAPVPRLALDEQRPYGEAFRRLQAVERTLTALHKSGETFVGLGYEGLAAGVLRP